MKVTKIENILPELESNFRAQRLIPFFGAGFTRGANTSTGKVPGTQEFRELMIREICATDSEFQTEMFEGTDFASISDIFYNRVAQDHIGRILKGRFTGVNLDRLPSEFLNVGWPYIYTLNIDDAIERATSYYPIYSNRPLNRHLTTDQCVFKIHGDANHDQAYQDRKSIIFSKGQYLQSLKENTSILSFLRSDLLQNSILFIGCSLVNELDLQDIATEIDLSQSLSRRFYVTSRIPDPVTKERLNLLGVTDIVLVDTYEAFYTSLLTQFKKNRNATPLEAIAPFRNLTIKREVREINANLPYLFADYSNISQNTMKIPFYSIAREGLAQLQQLVTEFPVIGVPGKRFSGKTLFLLTAIEQITGKTTYFFSSNISLSSTALQEALAARDSILYFDTNALSFSNLGTVADAAQTIKDNNSVAVIAINTSDRIQYSIVSNSPFTAFAPLHNMFNDSELQALNEKLSMLGITTFKANRTLLDSSFEAAQRYNIAPPLFGGDLLSNISDKEFTVIVLLLTFEKIYYKDLLDMGLTFSDIESFEKRYEKIVESEPTMNIEVHNHSKFKLTSNSNMILFHILKTLVNKNRKARSRLLNSILKIANTFHSLQDQRYKQIIMFDNVNFLASPENKGSIDFIFSLYSALESTLYNDPEYWHQRAKSILYSQNENLEELLKAHKYGQKAYHDSKDESRTRVNSSLTLSLISGRIANLQSFSEPRFVGESIHWFYEALHYDHLNTRYIEYVLKKSRHDKSNDLSNLVRHCLQNMQNYKEHEDRISYLYERIRGA